MLNATSPHWETASRVALPSGNVVPDLTVKRSQVLTTWNAQRRATRGAALQRERQAVQERSYAGASVNRLSGDWSALNTSADSEILTSLRILRARSRQLVRDNEYAKHAVRVITNNVVGNGIGMQAQVMSAGGKLQTKINDNIEATWAKWSKKKTCHVAGLLNFAEIERLCMVQLVTAGEAIVRKIRTPFGGGNIPLALEVMEADLLLDNWQTARAPNGNAIRMGVEIDEWHRPVAYWFSPKHPGDYQFTTFEPSRFVRVPAEDIIHLYIVERWPQSRGEPWFHAALKTLHNVGGYEDAEIVKARASANIVGFIRSPEPLAADGIANGRRVIDTEPGTWQTLLPGEEVSGYAPNTPNPAVDPFLRYMLRKMAVGVGVSYESLSRDYSQSNYSSSRMALLDDRDLYRVVQGFVCRNLREDIHSEFMDAAVLVGEIKVGGDYFTNPSKYQAVRYKPRGWSWIDPAKEVAAYKMAVRSGFMTVGDVIAQTSPDSDVEDTFKRREEELDMADDMGLVFDTNPAQVTEKGQEQGAAAPAPGEGAAPAAGAADGDAPADDSPDSKPATKPATKD
jgi:lambda family phage portal protein